MKNYKIFMSENVAAVIKLGLLTTIANAIKEDVRILLSSPDWQTKTIRFFIISGKIVLILFLLDMFSKDDSSTPTESLPEMVVNEDKKVVTEEDVKKIKSSLKIVDKKISLLKKKHIDSIKFEEEQLKIFVGKDKYKKEALKEILPIIRGKK